MADVETETSDTGLDIEQAASDIGRDLFPSHDKDEATEDLPEETPAHPPESPSPSPDAAAPPTGQDAPPAAPVVSSAPKSWAKEQHEHWAKMPPEAQKYVELREKQMLDGLGQYKGDAEFGKALRETFAPYRATLNTLQVDEAQAAKVLLDADHQLRYGNPQQKAAMLSKLARDYGVDLASVNAASPAPVDPNFQALQNQVHQLQTSLTQREQATLTEAKARVAKDVEAFAIDPKHAYFDEVADHIVILINGGKSLDAAYDEAVWANPVTRQKELARLQTEERDKLLAKAKTEADAAKHGKRPNVRTRDTQHAPTEPLGTMEDTIREALAKSKART